MVHRYTHQLNRFLPVCSGLCLFCNAPEILCSAPVSCTANALCSAPFASPVRKEPNRCNLEPLKPETPKIALYVVVAQGRLTLQVVWRDMKLQCLLLKYGQFISKPCVSPQVFYGSRRLTRCVLGSEAFRTREQTWESQPGGAQESDHRVKKK